ncbi:MAG: ribose 5-phosphate isomerase B [Dehalogenimonas sp.]|uniref:Ribose 5-phosphate isomerase B n=1 Tax=Candidatus Dehalogenimonas loeffleri TaxID=3127115 RepID=A0ABZ2J4P3_9CHLR|nr:ribose 5-phosphate isomerase B [Dehalogenimonas sp.]
MKIAIGNDHRGYGLKVKITALLSAQGHEVYDFGTDSAESADYPDFGHLVASKVVNDDADRGVLICGTGIGMSMTANKYPGARAALCYQTEYAELTRRHNDANILCLGELNGDDLNLEVLTVFINTEFEGGRHQRRIDKISACR